MIRVYESLYDFLFLYIISYFHKKINCFLKFLQFYTNCKVFALYTQLKRFRYYKTNKMYQYVRIVKILCFFRVIFLKIT